MPRFDAQNTLFELHAALDFARLDRLDDLWTSCLREPGEVPDSQVEALSRMAEEMLDVIGRVDEHALRLRATIIDTGHDFDTAFATILAAASVLTDAQRTKISQLVEGKGGFANFAVDQLDLLRDLVDTEMELLTAKMQSIDTRVLVEGDLSQRFKCALKIARLAAELALLIAGGVVLAPEVVAAVSAGAGAAAIAGTFMNLEGAHMVLEVIGLIEGMPKVMKEGCFREFKVPDGDFTL